MSLEASTSLDDSAKQSTNSLQEAWAVPEILAPAGGRAQFFAALNAGADAVYLGLKNFNARGRAENFSMEDLRELVPLARHRRMKVLVTLNILLKEIELPRLIADLSELQWIGIEACIIQDLGVARIIRKNFPTLRMHASTQLAVHNLAGVRAAVDLGFRRVVLARELTAQEMRKIRRELPREQVEIEAFCHGSLCYSYSGLCFFSGAEDARSGNRGECAYTCRQPYKIVSEPGHGFLFSMKDLNTSEDLAKLVGAGVDTLKIEGRKKDAQYVASSVGLYREKLNAIFGRDTSPKPGLHQTRNWARDMAFSFHRETTSLFVKGRYVENVIDLNNPTHKGLFIGKVARVVDRTIEFETLEALERFDGLRIEAPESAFHAQPQHGQSLKSSIQTARRRYANEETQFSLRDLTVQGSRLSSAPQGARVLIQVPDDVRRPQIGDLVYKIRSNELKRHTEALSQAPLDSRLRPLRQLQFSLRSEHGADTLRLTLTARIGQHSLAECHITTPAQRPEQAAQLQSDLSKILQVFGDCGVEAHSIEFIGDLNFFVPRTSLKLLKKQMSELLLKAIPKFTDASKESAENTLQAQRSRLAPAKTVAFQIKIDRPEYLPMIAAFCEQQPHFNLQEIIFEPKRAFLGKQSVPDLMQELEAFAQERACLLRIALPTVIRAWDEALLKPWLKAGLAQARAAFEIANLGALSLLQEAGCDLSQTDLTADFTLYTLNTEALLSLAEHHISQAALSIEDDLSNIKDRLRNWPAGIRPVSILYKDTPLFIAEACSLTALHQGCPSAAVCGYRSLEIENDKGERFFVAHESCKSIVYGQKAYAISQHRPRLQELGCADFRIDFLTRNYTPQAIEQILSLISREEQVPDTHTANFERVLL